MTNACQICSATNTNTFVYSSIMVPGSTVMCVDRDPCSVRENAKRVRDEARWAREDAEQWAREDAEQDAQDAWEDAQEAAYRAALPLLY